MTQQVSAPRPRRTAGPVGGVIGTVVAGTLEFDTCTASARCVAS